MLPLDGVWYFSSKTLHCENCLTKNHQDGTTTYYHNAITPVIVSEG
ncbi:MAG TPA: ISNCY family transposase, partial [Nitrospinaceae bacterium]|nr:ISNCY family transposase [Nitrospinaceae bacterium]